MDHAQGRPGAGRPADPAGIATYYAKDAGGEARPLAQQEIGSIRRCRLSGLHPRHRPHLAPLRGDTRAAPRSALAIGPCPDEATRAALRESGVEWALWNPTTRALSRMVLSNATAPVFSGEPRAQRLPTTLLGRAFKGLHRKDGRRQPPDDGAFLEHAVPL